jgi:uncharacterized Zn finger protein
VSRSERLARRPTLTAAQAGQLLEDLSDTLLKGLAGDKVFARGQAYAAGGAVQDLDHLPATPDHLLGVSATVHGSEPYQSEIWWLPDDDLGGDCDCPHGQDGFFCKHQVALALVWRAQLGGTPSAAEPDALKKMQAAAKRAQTQAQRLEALRQFVFAQKAQDLANMLWQLADHDRDVMARLQAWRSQGQAQQRMRIGNPTAWGRL